MKTLWISTLLWIACASAPSDGDSANGTSTQAPWAAPACPTLKRTEAVGKVLDPQIVEASGLVASHVHDGVLWTHNDSGDGSRIYALDSTGEHLGTWVIDDDKAADLEDIAVGKMGGFWWLFLADIGDNKKSRDHIVVSAISERNPANPDEQPTLLRRLELTYPDGPHDAETLLFDPLTEDLLILTKGTKDKVGVYHKPGLHAHDTTTTLTKVAEIDFQSEPLKGFFPTAGDVYIDGTWVTLRNYTDTIWLWPRNPARPLWEAFQQTPCTYAVLQEPQGESIAFGASGLSLWTLSEGTEQPLYRTTLTPDP